MAELTTVQLLKARKKMNPQVASDSPDAVCTLIFHGAQGII
jgi:hypothetical protein